MLNLSNDNKIGFLDSGIGGVTVLTKALDILPNEDYFFFSDSANNPYGDKSDDEIINRCDDILNMLINFQHCKAIVIACNTASAKAAEYLRKKYSDTPIIAIEPAYKMVHDFSPDEFTLVLATKGTIESEKFHRLYAKYNNDNTVLLSCVGMADLIEQNKKGELMDYLEALLSPYKDKAGNVVLGCTHYPLVKKEIANVLGNVRFFDGAEGVARQLKNVLSEKDLLNSKAEKGTVEFMDSSASEKAQNLKKKRFFDFISAKNA